MSNAEAFKPEKSVPVVNHGGGTIMLWGCFAANDTGTLHKSDGIMKEEDHQYILHIYLKSKAKWLKLEHSWVFQQDNGWHIGVYKPLTTTTASWVSS